MPWASRPWFKVAAVVPSVAMISPAHRPPSLTLVAPRIPCFPAGFVAASASERNVRR